MTEPVDSYNGLKFWENLESMRSVRNFEQNN